MTSGLSVYLRPRMALILVLGFASGLPLGLTGGTLQAWMKTEKVDLSTIGLFSLVGLPYALKFLWAPLLDRYAPPLFGRRRGWIILFQGLVAATLVALSSLSPSRAPFAVALVSVLVAFASASQDVVVDAYRIELLEPAEYGAGASVNVLGYRVAMLVSGGLALILSDHLSWSSVYRVMAAAMGIGILAALLGPSVPAAPAAKDLRGAVIEPLRDYFARRGALEMLAFIVLYKFGDNLAAGMTMPFYLEIGFTKTEVGALVKTVGMAATIVGGLVGGGLLVRLGLKHALWFFGFLQAISTAGFWLLARTGPIRSVLASVIGFENLTAGMGMSAYAALLMSLCNKRFTATQYALLTSLMAVMVKLSGATSGVLAKALGWQDYFLVCVVSALPGMLLLLRYDAWTTEIAEKEAIEGAMEAAAEPSTSRSR